LPLVAADPPILRKVYTLHDLEDAQVGHPTCGYAVDVCAFDVKTDDAAGEHIHDQQHPVTAQENRFAAE
jgi:hypothetical protein